VALYIHWFAHAFQWTPTEVLAQAIGDLDDLWRDVIYPRFLGEDD
jgi:hypothetical protein